MAIIRNELELKEKEVLSSLPEKINNESSSEEAELTIITHLYQKGSKLDKEDEKKLDVAFQGYIPRLHQNADQFFKEKKYDLALQGYKNTLNYLMIRCEKLNDDADYDNAFCSLFLYIANTNLKLITPSSKWTTDAKKNLQHIIEAKQYIDRANKTLAGNIKYKEYIQSGEKSITQIAWKLHLFHQVKVKHLIDSQLCSMKQLQVFYFHLKQSLTCLQQVAPVSKKDISTVETAYQKTINNFLKVTLQLADHYGIKAQKEGSIQNYQEAERFYEEHISILSQHKELIENDIHKKLIRIYNELYALTNSVIYFEKIQLHHALYQRGVKSELISEYSSFKLDEEEPTFKVKRPRSQFANDIVLFPLPEKDKVLISPPDIPHKIIQLSEFIKKTLDNKEHEMKPAEITKLKLLISNALLFMTTFYMKDKLHTHSCYAPLNLFMYQLCENALLFTPNHLQVKKRKEELQLNILIFAEDKQHLLLDISTPENILLYFDYILQEHFDKLSKIMNKIKFNQIMGQIFPYIESRINESIAPKETQKPSLSLQRG
jgi:hypothetical protein